MKFRLQDVADELGVSRKTIRVWLRELGVPPARSYPARVADRLRRLQRRKQRSRGLTAKEVAEQLGISVRQLDSLVRREGLRAGKGRGKAGAFSPETVARIRELLTQRQKRLKLQDVAQELGISRSQLYRRLHQAGFPKTRWQRGISSDVLEQLRKTCSPVAPGTTGPYLSTREVSAQLQVAVNTLQTWAMYEPSLQVPKVGCRLRWRPRDVATAKALKQRVQGRSRPKKSNAVSISEAASELDCSAATVYRWGRKLGLDLAGGVTPQALRKLKAARRSKRGARS